MLPIKKILATPKAVSDISFGDHEAPRSSAADARIEAPKAPRRGEVWGGVSPFPLGVGSGGPLPRNFVQSYINKTACFGRF